MTLNYRFRPGSSAVPARRGWLSAGDRIAIAFAVAFFIVIGAWVINDAFALMANGFAGGLVGNGWLWLGAVQAFHVGLWLVIGGTAAMFLLVLDTALLAAGRRSA